MDRFLYLKILKENLAASKRKMEINEFIFQQDNDTKHTSGLVKTYFEEKNFEVLPWPLQSPDLNPIEHVWAYIKKKLGNKKYSKEGLIAEVTRIWNSIPVSLCQKLVYSMEKRLKSVVLAKGRSTKY